MNELKRHVVIVNDLGLHARAAAKVAALAQKARSTVWISWEAETADASSIIDILTLACPKGTRLSVTVEDPSDSGILEAIVALIENGFDE